MQSKEQSGCLQSMRFAGYFAEIIRTQPYPHLMMSVGCTLQISCNLFKVCLWVACIVAAAMNFSLSFFQKIESRLKVSLPSDLGAALTDGVVLCHLANHVRPRSVPSIHVPSPAVVSIPLRALWLLDRIRTCFSNLILSSGLKGPQAMKQQMTAKDKQ